MDQLVWPFFWSFTPEKREEAIDQRLTLSKLNNSPNSTLQFAWPLFSICSLPLMSFVFWCCRRCNSNNDNISASIRSLQFVPSTSLSSSLDRRRRREDLETNFKSRICLSPFHELKRKTLNHCPQVGSDKLQRFISTLQIYPHALCNKFYEI